MMRRGPVMWSALAERLYEYIISTKESHRLNIVRDDGLYKYTSRELKRAIGLNPDASGPLLGYTLRILEADGKIKIVRKKLSWRHAHTLMGKKHVRCVVYIIKVLGK